MELFELIKWGTYVLTAIAGWFIKLLWDAQKEMRQDLQKIELNLSENYIKKNDFKDVILELKEDFKEMSKPLFSKLDRIEEYLLHNRKGQ